MKRLIMCEGPNELEIVNILLEHHALVFEEDDLLGLTPYHARQISSSTQVRAALNMYPGNDVLIMRIGDKQGDKLKIPEEYRDKVCGIEKYCTKPELEMLLIVSENLCDEFEKTKSTVSPKEFAKAHIECGRKRYNNSSAFYREYYGSDCPKLRSALLEYKRLKRSHKKDELYLADLLTE